MRRLSPLTMEDKVAYLIGGIVFPLSGFLVVFLWLAAVLGPS